MKLAPRQPVARPLWESDANEFGRHFRQGGWRLGLLVARNVEPAPAGRPSNCPPVDKSSEKVGVREFAEKAGVSKSTVAYYFKAWELAADAGLVLHASDLAPGDEDSGVSELEEDNQDDEERREQWKLFYRKARTPDEPKPKTEASKPKKTSIDDSDDDDDENDSETEAFTAEEIAQADRASITAEILDRLETMRSMESWLKSIASVEDSEQQRLLREVSSIALDVHTMANQLVALQDSELTLK